MSELNTKSLEEEFDIEPEEVSIETFREALNRAKEIENPDNVLSTVIEKAGIFLGKIERESEYNMSARYMETASQILNTLITATNSMVDNQSKKYNDHLKHVRITQRDRELDQRDKELQIKELYYNNKLKSEENSKNTTNVLVTNREDIMKFLENKRKGSIENTTQSIEEGEQGE